MNMLKRLAAVYCVSLLLLSCATETIKIYSFNIQIFGVAKMSKPEVVDILLQIVSEADLVAVQEVRSASADPVTQFMSRMPQTYRYVIGPREGRGRSKEQYWVMYNSEKLTVLDSAAWPDPEDKFERNPFGVYFQTKDRFDFILINNHIQPSGAAAEIEALPEAVAYFQELWNEPDVLVVGDFNADGAYYDESLLETVFPYNEYLILITNDYDTTVAKSENTYDRIIITSSAREDYTGKSGVVRFDELYDFQQYTIEPRHVSDHYPIWAEFVLDADTD
jgi:endonuclease/exonuclease/phosphatase family metal-dependent hydrolase